MKIQNSKKSFEQFLSLYILDEIEYVLDGKLFGSWKLLAIRRSAEDGVKIEKIRLDWTQFEKRLNPMTLNFIWSTSARFQKRTLYARTCRARCTGWMTARMMIAASRQGQKTIANQGSRALIIEQTCRGRFSAVSKPIFLRYFETSWRSTRFPHVYTALQNFEKNLHLYKLTNFAGLAKSVTFRP